MIDLVSSKKIYQGENVICKFTSEILEEVKYCKKVMKKYFQKDFNISKIDEKNFKTDNKCHICNKLYTEKILK